MTTDTLKSHIRAHLNEVEDLVDGMPDGRPAVPQQESSLTWVDLLVRHWPWMALGTLLGAMLATAYLTLTPSHYMAQALIVPVRARTQVQFEPRITTVASTGSDTAQSTSAAERRQALADLVKSTPIEAAVAQQLASRLPPSELSPGSLIQRVRGVVNPKSEVIAIQAEDASPGDAVMIANAWATSYVDQMNSLFAGDTSGTTLDTLVKERDQASAQNQAAQQAVTDAIAASDVDALRREIEGKQNELGLLRSPYAATTTAQRVPAFTVPAPASSTTAPTPQNGSPTGQVPQPAPASPLANTETVNPSELGLIRDYRLMDLHRLEDMAEMIRRVDAARDSARALLGQADASDNLPNNQAALQLLRSQLVSVASLSSSNALPAQIQLQLPVGSEVESAANLRALVTGLDQVRDALTEQFQSERAGYEAAAQVRIKQLEDDLRQLNGRLESGEATVRNVTAQRDLSWDTYSALARKVEERRVADATSGREVEIASTASVAEPLSKGGVGLVVLGALSGLAVVGLVVAARALVPATEKRTQGGLRGTV